MSGRKLPPPPDFGGDEWFHEYAMEHYLDPATRDIVYVRLDSSVTSHDRAIQRKLEEYLFAKSYCYEHENGLVGGEIIRVFSGQALVKLWGLLGDQENWIVAVLVDGSWRVLTKRESWHFDFLLAGDKKKKLVGVDFCVNNRLIETIMKDE